MIALTATTIVMVITAIKLITIAITTIIKYTIAVVIIIAIMLVKVDFTLIITFLNQISLNFANLIYHLLPLSGVRTNSST